MRHEKCITYPNDLEHVQAVSWDENKEKVLQRAKAWIFAGGLSIMGFIAKLIARCTTESFAVVLVYCVLVILVTAVLICICKGMTYLSKRIKAYSVKKGWTFLPVIVDLLFLALGCMLLYVGAMSVSSVCLILLGGICCLYVVFKGLFYIFDAHPKALVIFFILWFIMKVFLMP